MADIPIWPGSSSFSLTNQPTPFGFYDDDVQFRDDADKVSVWMASRLGYPLIDIELQAINFFTCFEEAVNEYGAQLYNFQIINNFYTLKGTSTGSALNQIDVATSILGISEDYGGEAGGGISSTKGPKIHSGSLEVKKNVQRYDLKADAFSSVSGSDIKIKKIYHYAPAALNRYFDPYAGTGTGIQSLMQAFGFGNYSPGVNFMLMPIYFDVLKLQAIEFNDQIRKSQYHFDLNAGQFLRLFPIPDRDYTLWFEYTMTDSSTSPATTTGPTGDDTEKDKGLITDISNAPYTRPIYEYINEPGRQWIRKYTLALAKEMLGSIRGKYQSLPIPGSETTLDFSRLLSEAQAEKTALIEQLREDLEATTTLRQKERSTLESEQQQAQYSVDNPYQIYIH